MNITASAAGHTFTRTSKVDWAYATITVFASGRAHVNWAKSFAGADKFAEYKRIEIATGANDAPDPMTEVHVVVTTIE